MLSMRYIIALLHTCYLPRELSAGGLVSALWNHASSENIPRHVRIRMPDIDSGLKNRLEP